MGTHSFRFLLSRLWHHVGRLRRGQFILLLLLLLFAAITEIVSLGAVLPFIMVLAAPDRVFEYGVVANVAAYFGITSADQLVLPLTIAFALAAIVAGATRIFVTWLSTRLTYACGADIAIEVYRRMLYQPYQVHVAQSSSEMISGVMGKVGNTMLGVLLPVITLITSGILVIAIIFTLIAINPTVAIVAGIGFGASYGLITLFVRRRLERNSEVIASQHTLAVKALQEGLGGIRDVLLDGTQPVFCEIFRQADRQWRIAQGQNIFVGQSPRYAMEAISMVLIAFLTLALSRQQGGIVLALPALGALALGAQRLMPVLQQAYNAWASIAGNRASAADIIELLDRPISPELLKPKPAPFVLSRSIRFERVGFRYAPDGPWVLKDFDLTIPKGVRLGVVGSTGSGKSTMMDLLMGLLSPSEGQIVIDGEALADDLVRAWQRSIAHVPQSIFLSDATFAENIAFGVRRESIDLERVRLAARQAQIADFIEGERDGYQAVVGERGIRLSGGQRQRIGIARALYKQASVLVLDEATSALDNVTEQSIVDSIECLDRDLTILIIAHRLSTVRHCDSIVELEQGHVSAQGEYEQLIQASESFRQMATRD